MGVNVLTELQIPSDKYHFKHGITEATQSLLKQSLLLSFCTHFVERY